MSKIAIALLGGAIVSVVALAFLWIAFRGRAKQWEGWKLDLGIRNEGSLRIDEASVQWGDYKSTAGIVSPSKEAVEVSLELPIPEAAEVYCTLPDGKSIRKTVPVRSQVPAKAQEDRDMCVLFVVNSDTGEVSVRFLHFVQVEDSWRKVPYQ